MFNLQSIFANVDFGRIVQGFQTAQSIYGVIDGYNQVQAGEVAYERAQQIATQSRALTQLDVKRQRIAARKATGAARAKYGGSGVSLEGSPLDVLEESASNGELDALILEYRGELEAEDILYQGTLARQKAQNAGYSTIGKAAGQLFKTNPFKNT